MIRLEPQRSPVFRRIIAGVLFLGLARNTFANPEGLTVQAGSASLQQVGPQLNITASQAAFLNWNSFNIQPGETTKFIQPSQNSVVINNIGGNSPSQIWGNLTANGTVILANASGFYFGPNSMISVGGSFIATTAPLTPDFGAGTAWQFTGMPPLANIVNYGQIEVGNGKSLFLIAEQIDNHGELSAPGGDIGLYGGAEVLVSERPDGRGLSANLKVPEGAVNNFGRITADAGTIALQAQVVNQNGIIQADSIRNQNGVIELVAADSLNLGVDSQILARGDDSSAVSPGGIVTLKSGNNFNDTAGGKILATGGAHGGNGGSIEVSAPNVLLLDSSLDARAQSGWRGGEFFLDPVNIILGTSTAGGAINVNTAFAGFSTILLQASGNISLNANTLWNLSGSTGQSAGQLTLEAGGDIAFGSKSQIFDANNWSVTLDAGYNFANNSINAGTGNIYLNGGSGQTQNASIQTSAGSINLFAGQSILLASQNNHSKQIVSGPVFTTGGGNIFAQAVNGDIDAGTSNGGTSSTSQSSDYNFTDTGAAPNPVLGGISTKAGGNVTLIAGHNIDSTPVVPSRQWPGASGAYGAGDVTIIAGNQINGNYNLANGTGTMLAGVTVSSAQAGALQNPGANPATYASTLHDLETAVMQSGQGNIGGVEYAGASPSAVSLSLISGSWNVWAGNNIFLKEVNNPNGTFNSAQSYLYNYAPDAAANLWAGNAIELAGGSVGGTLARVSRGNQNIIYAPSLSLNAGAGGILIDKNIILAPSAQGGLNLTTRGGGNLSGAVTPGSTALTGITMSDSDSTDYRTFTSGHATTPLHLNDPNPVRLDISGSIGSLALKVPTFAEITVAASKPFVTPDGVSVFGTYNFGFLGRNLSPLQTTFINVAGDLTYRGDVSTINLTADQLSDLLPTRLFADSADTAATAKLRYDSATGKLIYIGVMSAADLAFLLNPSIIVRDQFGNPVTQAVLDADGNPVLDEEGNPTSFVVTEPLPLDATQQGMINQLFAASQSASLGDQGLALAGAGKFKVNANGLDLGVSGGISVLAPDAALAAISPYGADLQITTPGNLAMTSTKIANESLLGGIELNVGGSLDVGGQFSTFGDPGAAKGIFTTSGGNVAITAGGNINVNGSRIAAYNGGDLNITSQNGDVNAGAGGLGFVSLNALELDPVTQTLTTFPANIPGSGILATTIFGSHGSLGNIVISAPNGSVNASLGGVFQIAFNGANARANFVAINAGHDINAQGSGIIGSNIRLQAGGDINGLVIGSQSVNINSGQSVDVTVVSGGNVEISASGDVSGSITGGGSVNVSGDSIEASVSGNSIASSGDISGAAIGVPQSNVAQNNAQNADTAETATAKTDNSNADDLKNKKPITLAQKVSRVTVLLPAKN
jgi:filamentous hemagglutinin family protein